MSRWVSAAVLGAVLCSASIARADTVSEQDKAQAMEKFDAGSKAFDQKRYKDAIDLFLAADALVKNPAFAYNASFAYEKMGDVTAALKWAREYLRRAPSAADQAAVRDRIAKFEAHLRESGLRQLTVISNPPGATLLVDHRPVGVTPWTGELIPGSHTIELRLRGYTDRSTTAELNGDGSVETALDLSVAEAAPKAVVPEAPPATPEKPRTDWLLPTSISALSAGVISGGIAVGLEFARSSAEHTAHNDKTQVDAASDYQRMQHLQLGARVAAGVAGGLGLVGGILLTVRLAGGKPGAARSSTSAASVPPLLLLGPSGGSFQLRF